MISTPNTILRKLNAPSELTFIKDKGFIQFALEVEEPQALPNILNKLKKSTTGLYIKTDGENLIRNAADVENVTVHQIPSHIKSLQKCCEWIYNCYTPNPQYALGSIAADKTRIVINSCHSLTDGSFYQRLLQDITSSDSNHLFDSIFPLSGDLKTDLLKNEFSDFINNESTYLKKLVPFNRRDYTYIDIQERPDMPNPDDQLMMRLTHELDIDQLSIYDPKTKKVKGLSEFLWTALTMSINVINGSFGSFGLGTCMDFRRLIPSTRINNRFGSAFTDFYITIKNPSPRMTISNICNEFRKSFNIIKNNNGFYEQYLHPFNFPMEGRSIGSVSNVGPFEFKKPIKDIYCQFFALEKMIQNQMQVTTLSKVRKDLGLNRCIYQYFFSPKIISKKTGSELFQTFIYFIKNVKPYMKAGDVYNELLNFRNSLL